MRNIYIILITFILYNLIPLKPYVECNKLNVIKSITITCNEEYEVKYKEIKPNKEENGIKYYYKNYINKSNNLENAIKEIEKGKKIYKDKAKIYINKCKNKKEIISIIKGD